MSVSDNWLPFARSIYAVCTTLMLPWLLTLSFPITAMASTVEFFVSPVGDDTTDGSAHRPFATLSRARDTVRNLDHRHNATSIWIGGGDYRLREPLILHEEDSGTAEAPINYRNIEGETPRLLGGIEIPPSAWGSVPETILRNLTVDARESVRQVSLANFGVEPVGRPPNAFKGSPLPELFVDGERMPIARWPNDSWATFTNVVDRGTRTGSDETHRGGTFI